MRTKIILAFALALMTIFAVVSIKSLKDKNDVLLSNQKILLEQKKAIMAENQVYKVSDSLSAAKVSELQLTLKEYKKYRADDLKLIEQLNVKKSDLQKVIESQTETINRLSAELSDSIVVNNDIVDTLKCFSYKSKWTDVSGCIDLAHDNINIQVKNRESLDIIETVVHKRFLGFLWKTNQIKDRQIDVVSKNPNTTIVNLEYVSIKR